MSNASVPKPVVVSVVIPSVDGFEMLRACLAALREQTFRGFETIVVDNGSTEKTGRLAGEHFPEVRVLQLKTNIGFGAGVNAGAQAASGEYLALLNNDTTPRPEWLAELVECARRHPEAASIAPKILRDGDPSVIDGAGDCMTLALKAYRRGLGERDKGQYDREEQVFSATGTACLWRAEAFRQLGGFDECFFAYYEDVDLGFRARLAGYECWYTPRALVLHQGAGTSRRDWPTFEALHSVRNRWLMITKDAPARWIALNLHRILIAELMSLARALAKGELALVFRAYGEVVRSRARVHRQRAQVQTEARVLYPELRALVQRGLPPIGMAWRRFRYTGGIGSADGRATPGGAA